MENEIKEKDEKFAEEVKNKEEEVNELQKKLVSGTGGEEILKDLQEKLDRVER